MNASASREKLPFGDVIECIFNAERRSTLPAIRNGRIEVHSNLAVAIDGFGFYRNLSEISFCSNLNSNFVFARPMGNLLFHSAVSCGLMPIATTSAAPEQTAIAIEKRVAEPCVTLFRPLAHVKGIYMGRKRLEPSLLQAKCDIVHDSYFTWSFCIVLIL